MLLYFVSYSMFLMLTPFHDLGCAAVTESEITWAYPNDKEPFWKVLESKLAVQAACPPTVANVPRSGESVYTVHITAEMAPIAKVLASEERSYFLGEYGHRKGEGLMYPRCFATVVGWWSR